MPQTVFEEYIETEKCVWCILLYDVIVLSWFVEWISVKDEEEWRVSP